MFSRNVLLLLVAAASVLSKITRPGSDECFFVVNVPGKRMVSFGNINWPDKYTSGEICQWVFFCPNEYFCRLRCPDVGLPKTDDCYMDKLLVYTKGKTPITTTRRPRKHSHPLRYKGSEPARVYCGRTTINVRSNGTKIAMVLISHESSPGGRFRCTVTPEKNLLPKKKKKSKQRQMVTTSSVEKSY
ncbi:unnamed protein product [Arctia plantaginis]|uniref:CUB domain-containing protein n=1 Tax=Arctia plantaginis TaxID=874455 RepID=A0A8S0ZBC7_ARCPL|nr:unnamed protein product [Arctia plantaginis]